MFAWKVKLITACVGLILRAALSGPDVQAGEAESKSITLAYIADLHAQLDSHAEFFWHGKEEMAIAGGVARIATAIEAIRRERPGRVLFMDAGDTIQGSAAAAWTEGKAVVAPINALNLDLGLSLIHI